MPEWPPFHSGIVLSGTIMSYTIYRVLNLDGSLKGYARLATQKGISFYVNRPDLKLIKLTPPLKLEVASYIYNKLIGAHRAGKPEPYIDDILDNPVKKLNVKTRRRRSTRIEGEHTITVVEAIFSTSEKNCMPNRYLDK